MSTSSYSSINTHRRGRTPHDDIDRSVYTVGQTLVSIVNDPRTASQTSGGFWGLGHDASQNAQPPPLDPARYPVVSKADVQRYIDLVHGTYERFIRDRHSLEAFDAQHQDGSSGGALLLQYNPSLTPSAQQRSDPVLPDHHGLQHVAFMIVIISLLQAALPLFCGMYLVQLRTIFRHAGFVHESCVGLLQTQVHPEIRASLSWQLCKQFQWTFSTRIFSSPGRSQGTVMTH